MRRRLQRGGVIVIAAITIPTIVLIASGLIVLGRIQVMRQRLQYAADAMATDGALVAKRQGLAVPTSPNTSGLGYAWLPSMPTTMARLQASRDGNLPLAVAPVLPTWSLQRNLDATDWVYAQSSPTTSYAGITLNATAAVRIREVRTGAPRRRPPAFVLVLDYSNSMNKTSAAFGVAINQLRTAVTMFLDSLNQYDLRVGLVLYSTGVFQTVAPATRAESNDFPEIRAALASPANGDTATGPAIQAAVAMMTAMPENFGRNLMLISDGVPCCSGDALAAAEDAGNAARAAQVQVIAAVVQHDGTTGDPNAVLQDIAGSSVAPYFFAINDTAALQALITSVNVQPLCDIPAPSPYDVNDTFAFVRNDVAGTEVPLQLYADTSKIGCPDGCNVYGYVLQQQPLPLVIYSSQACNDIFTKQDVALMRSGPPILSL